MCPQSLTFYQVGLKLRLCVILGRWNGENLLILHPIHPSRAYPALHSTANGS
jgi:hypothetical protein